MPPRPHTPFLERFPMYRSKSALKDAVRAEVAPHPYNHEFTSELVSELIAKNHYYCAPRGLRPERFRKLRRPGGDPAKHYDFEGWFPGVGWHGVSWTKCVDGQSWDTELAGGLRAEIVDDVVARQRGHPTCERCGRVPSVETDHIEPEFDELIARALDGLTEDAIRSAFAEYDWQRHERFRLPEGHVIRHRFLEAHAHARLMAVCHACHLANADDRRRSARSR